MAGDDLDALLQLAEEADDAANPATASELAPGGAAGGPSTAADDDDPLLGLADAICATDAAQTAGTALLSRQNTDTSKPAARPALCSTRAFSAATPGSSRNTSSSRLGPGPGNSSSTAAMPRQQQEVQHFVEKLTGLKIKLPRVSGVVLKERYRAVTCVPVSKAQ